MAWEIYLRLKDTEEQLKDCKEALSCALHDLQQMKLVLPLHTMLCTQASLAQIMLSTLPDCCFDCILALQWSFLALPVTLACEMLPLALAVHS